MNKRFALLHIVSLFVVVLLACGLSGCVSTSDRSGEQPESSEDSYELNEDALALPSDSDPKPKIEDQTLDLEINLLVEGDKDGDYYWEIINLNDFAVPYMVTFTYRDSDGVFIDNYEVKRCEVSNVYQLDEMLFIPPQGRVVVSAGFSFYGTTLYDDGTNIEARATIPSDCDFSVWGWKWDSEVRMVEATFVTGDECQSCKRLGVFGFDTELVITFKASDSLPSAGIVQVIWYDNNGVIIGTSVESSFEKAEKEIPAGETAKIRIPCSNVRDYEVVFLGLSKVRTTGHTFEELKQ